MRAGGVWQTCSRHVLPTFWFAGNNSPPSPSHHVGTNPNQLPSSVHVRKSDLWSEDAESDIWSVSEDGSQVEQHS